MFQLINEDEWNKAHEDYNLIYKYLDKGGRFLKEIKHAKDFYLLHVTSKDKINEIIKSGNLYPSGGCLVGSIYCTPLIRISENIFRLHNLGAFYYQIEIPNSLNMNDDNISPKEEVSGLLIKYTLKNRNRTSLLGVNYLKLGNIHYANFLSLSYLLTQSERGKINDIIKGRLSKIKPFLIKSISIFEGKEDLLSEDFLIEFIERIPEVSIFGYIYFEALSQYIIINQDDEASSSYTKMGEIYNWNYKDLMFKLYPNFYDNFNLSTFSPNIKKIIELLKEARYISDFCSVKFISDLSTGILNILISSCIDIPNNDVTNHQQNLTEEKIFNPLLGHLIHRELRNFKRYPDFYFYFDQQKALQIWNFWNKNNVLFSFNGIVPKGEIGINPAFLDETDYQVFRTSSFIKKNKLYYLKKEEELDIKIVPRLGDLKKSFRRTKF